MITRKTFLFTQALLFSLSSFSNCLCLAQEVAEKPAQQAPAPNQAEIFQKASKVANEDLSDLKHPVKPMLWKVEGKGLEKASYLFGSIHVADANIINLHPDAEAAYQQSDTLATEVNFGLLSQLKAAKKMIRKDKKTLKESVGEDIYTELDAQLAEIHPSLNAKPFNNMKTWAVMLIHGMVEEQMNGGKPLDLQLWEKAGKDDKQQWALETVDEQLGGLDKLTDEEQKTLLKDALYAAKILKKEKINGINLIKNLYLKGDTDELLSLILLLGQLEGTNQEVADKFGKLLLSDRNDRMAAKILKTFTEMPDKSHFIVAGTLHYLGENNVIDLLRKQGYKVTKQ